MQPGGTDQLARQTQEPGTTAIGEKRGRNGLALDEFLKV
jgi:hypothetical protein